MIRRTLTIALALALGTWAAHAQAPDAPTEPPPAADAPPAEPPPAADAPPAETPAPETPAPDAPEAPATEAPAPETPAPGAPAPEAPASEAPASPAATPSPTASAAAEPLPPDVPEKHWAAGAVRRALKRTMLDLHGGKFNGSQTATRRDLAMVVGGVLQAAGKGGASVKATDLEANDPAARSIALAAGSGAVKLRRGNKLGPNQPITREDLAHAMSRLLAVVRGEKEGPVGDPVELNDLPPDSPLFNPVQRVLKAKIISLINLKYEGYLPVPRFQLASVASKVLDVIKK